MGTHKKRGTIFLAETRHEFKRKPEGQILLTAHGRSSRIAQGRLSKFLLISTTNGNLSGKSLEGLGRSELSEGVRGTWVGWGVPKKAAGLYTMDVE